MARKKRSDGTEISAGGVAFRSSGAAVEVALISVGASRRWQLPKGTVDPGESNEQAALREVREEAGISTEIVSSLDRIEYWYYSTAGPRKIRHHKFVYFFLLRYLDGDPNDHDDEVNEACWVEIGRAYEMLTFENERKILDRARAALAATAGNSGQREGK